MLEQDGAIAPLSKHHLKLWRMINRYVRCYGAFECNLSHKAMMKETGKKLRTVGRYLADLKRGGFIAIQFRPNKTSLYNVLADPHGRCKCKMADPFGRSNGRSYKVELKSELKSEPRRPPQMEKRTDGRRYSWEFEDCDPVELQRFIEEHEKRRQA